MMRRPVLHTVASALGAGFALAVLSFAFLANYGATESARTGAAPLAAPGNGAVLFADRCARCHSEAEAAAPLHHAADASAAQRALAQFLAGHGKSAHDENAPIVAFLATVPPAATVETDSEDFEL
jgi:mono/diheme cytochrome c family protein